MCDYKKQNIILYMFETHKHTHKNKERNGYLTFFPPPFSKQK